MCEAIAQLGAYVVLQDERFVGRIPLFGGLDKARFRRQVLPGERVDLRIDVQRACPPEPARPPEPPASTAKLRAPPT